MDFEKFYGVLGEPLLKSGGYTEEMVRILYGETYAKGRSIKEFLYDFYLGGSLNGKKY